MLLAAGEIEMVHLLEVPLGWHVCRLHEMAHL